MKFFKFQNILVIGFGFQLQFLLLFLKCFWSVKFLNEYVGEINGGVEIYF